MTATLNATGMISISEHTADSYDPLALTTRSYHWEGGEVARASAYMLRDYLIMDREMVVGECFNLGPWRLRVIEYDFYSDTLLVMRHGWRSSVRMWAISARKPLERAYGRLILTAHVWGWARVPAGVVPSRHHLCLPWKQGKR
jgi:hypothetical protein